MLAMCPPLHIKCHLPCFLSSYQVMEGESFQPKKNPEKLSKGKPEAENQIKFMIDI